MALDNEYFKPYFANSYFGSTNYAELIQEGLMKVVCGYHNGMTMSNILINNGLVKVNAKGLRSLTDKGRIYLYRLYKQGKNT